MSTKIIIEEGKKLDKDVILEQLRKAGVIGVNKNRIIIYPPKYASVKRWAEQNKNRMHNIGIEKVEIIK